MYVKKRNELKSNLPMCIYNEEETPVGLLRHSAAKKLPFDATKKMHALSTLAYDIWIK